MVSLFDTYGVAVDIVTVTASGAFSFTVPAGTYFLNVIAPAGYVFSPQNQGGDSSLDSDVDPLTGLTGAFSVAPDRWTTAATPAFIWRRLPHRPPHRRPRPRRRRSRRP